MSEARAAHAASMRLSRLYRDASPALRQSGRRWYPAANDLARELAREAPRGIGPYAMAGVIAVLSPRLRWAANVADASSMAIAAGRVSDDPIFGDLAPDGAAQNAARFALGVNVRKAARILAGDDPAALVTGPKTRAFWAAIRGDVESVTVDVWAALAAGFDPDRLTPKRHRIITDAYVRAACRAKETPRDFQAIVWLQIRGAKPSDPGGMVVA